MPTYSYKAYDESGKVVNGTIEAKDLSMATSHLQSSNCFPISIAEQKDKEKRSFALPFLSGVKQKDILVFTQQLSTLLNAGVPLDRALSIIIKLTSDSKFKTIAETVEKNVRGGASFADALSKHPKAFSRLYVNMLRAGEAGGVIDIITARLAEFLEKSQELKDYIISAMIYPTVLMLVGGIAVFILLTFVIPKFANIFSDMGQTLPLPTLILLGFSNFIVDYWWVFVLAMGLGYGAFKMYVGTEQGEDKWDSLKLKMPLFGSLVERIQVARFSRTLGTLVKGGVPLLEGLAIVKEVIENSIISKAMENIKEGVKQGDGVSEPMRETGVFPALAVHMLQIGEETGNLDEMLLKVADIYDKEVRSETKKLIALLEPFMILLMGLIIGLIVISMLMAIFSVNELPF